MADETRRRLPYVKAETFPKFEPAMPLPKKDFKTRASAVPVQERIKRASAPEPSSPGFIPVETRKKQAEARTTAPGGGYRLGPPNPGQPSPAKPASTSKAQLQERLSEEQATGEVVRKAPSPLSKVFVTRKYDTHSYD